MLKEGSAVFVENNDAGLAMVKRQKKKYAFFAEDTQIQYFMHRECTVTKIGERLDSKEYGIGMPMSE